MSGSVRRFLAVGTAAVAATAIVGAPAPRPRTVQAAPPITVTKVDLAAAVTPLTPADREQFTSARAALTRLDPVSPLAAVPAPLNAATNSINSVYQWIQGWVDYGVQLTQYVLQFIPYGYLIGDQVGIVYYNLVRPISDSVVYDLIDPVVSNPLNLATWVNGAIAVGQTTVRSLINTGIAEFNYFFGWLIPPLPPLPLAAKVTTEETPAASTLSALNEPTPEPKTAAAEKKDGTDTVVDAAVAKKDPETTKATDAKTDGVQPTKTETEAVTTTETEAPTAKTDPVATDVAPVSKPTVDTKDGVSAQGEVRTGGQSTSPEKTADTADKPDKKDAPTVATETKAPEQPTPEPEKTAVKPSDAKPAGD